MATIQNPLPVRMANGEEHGRLENSRTTGLIRQITFKILPVFGFLLVVFSAGAILVSTFSFSEPLPRQAALAISILLLLFFVLFSAGIVYLRSRNIQSHTSEKQDTTGYPLYDIGISRDRPDAHSNRNYDVLPSGARGGLVSTDTLEGRAPSPRAFLGRARASQERGQDQNTLPGIEGTFSRPRPSGNFETSRSSNNRVPAYNERNQANSGFTPRSYRLHARPDSLSPRSGPFAFPLEKGLAPGPYPAVMPPMRPSMDPRRARPSLSTDAPISPDSERLRSEQPQPTRLETREKNKLPKPPTNLTESYEHKGSLSPGFREKSPTKRPYTKKDNASSLNQDPSPQPVPPHPKTRTGKGHTIHKPFSFELESATAHPGIKQDTISPPPNATDSRLLQSKIITSTFKGSDIPRHPSAIPSPLHLPSKSKLEKSHRLDTSLPSQQPTQPTQITQPEVLSSPLHRVPLTPPPQRPRTAYRPRRVNAEAEAGDAIAPGPGSQDSVQQRGSSTSSRSRGPPPVPQRRSSRRRKQ
ncbi:hypothetical protein F5Y08DRAFT_355709 [Xylaria arbuscula]|nr:hypothetical protein F5Y08DRAFT_355709 [Xylaria arbuscula]